MLLQDFSRYTHARILSIGTENKTRPFPQKVGTVVRIHTMTQSDYFYTFELHPPSPSICLVY